MRISALVGGAWLAACLLLPAAGCRSGSAPLAPVRGKVSYRGQPLRSGAIVFAPDASRGTQGDLAVAEIQPDGSYTLKTGNASGAVVGWHRVTVCSLLPAVAVPPGQPPPPPVALLPIRYHDPRLSGLSCEVKADQPNSIDFQLE
jgi:hypothetical protein